MFSYCGQIKRELGFGQRSASTAPRACPTAASMDSAQGGEPRGVTASATIDPYVQEHMDLINAIVKDTELNEAKQVTDSTLTAIMGREAAYSGAGVEWDAMLNSSFTYAPKLLYTDASKLSYGDFRVLQPPMPSRHNILKDPAVIQVEKA